ncbi:hypothetical protein BDD43_5680 [Mucilaginibacter gracilis]|uniref:TonB dependent receptor n=1 Tax=Mucilaginibacter gracilis TaxID=423350 RepID=A0A495JBG9_9SPHI|nr:hypothetical protein [Mucilaginibacter gracilis]RKR85409.1 hypothetical protein BDD43_5680 [Mucilaginibacter gracilis]
MKLRYITTFVTVAAFFCLTHADAQVKKPAAKKLAAKTVKPTAKTNAAAKKVVGIAKRLTDTVKRGGQPNPTPVKDNNSLTEEIVVTTAYKPVLADAVKIRRNPDLEDKEPFKAPLHYNALDKALQDNTDIKQMPAMKIPKEKDADLRSSYAKLGVGSFKTTYGELYVDNGKDEALQVGGYLKHLAQNGSLYRQNFMKDDAGIFGKSIGDESSISGRINYNYRSNYFYGYDELNPPATLHVDKQHFSTLSGEAEIAKNYKDEDDQFIYALKLSGYNFTNAFQAKENNLTLSGYINQTISQFYAGLSGSVDFNTVKDSLYSFNNNIVRVNPYLKFQGTNYKIDAGINITSEFGGQTRFRLFPAAKLEFQVIPKYVRLFAEVRGDVNKSSLRDFSQANPFLGQDINVQNTVDQLDLAAGLKGMLAPGLGFKATFFRNSVKNMALFVNDFNFATGYNRFKVIYDGGNSRVSGFNGELDYKPADDLDIFGRIELKDYQLATEAQAWNLPKFVLTAGTAIKINDKVSITGSVLFHSDTKDMLSATQMASIKSFVDLSGGVEYKATNRLSIFGQVNNILNSTYQTWLYYPNYGFNIFGGVGYKF